MAKDPKIEQVLEDLEKRLNNRNKLNNNNRKSHCLIVLLLHYSEVYLVAIGLHGKKKKMVLDKMLDHS